MSLELEASNARIGELNAENAHLKAEVERLDTLCKQVMAQHSDISCENIMLRRAEVADLNRQVSTLREAGDELWYAGRHKDRALMIDAMEEWAECRDNCRG